MATVDAMKIANKEMKKQYKNIDIDKIEVGPSLNLLPIETCVVDKQFQPRTYITIWRNSLNRRMKFKRHWAEHMVCRMRWTRLTLKPVRYCVASEDFNLKPI